MSLGLTLSGLAYGAVFMAWNGPQADPSEALSQIDPDGFVDVFSQLYGQTFPGHLGHELSLAIMLAVLALVWLLLSELFNLKALEARLETASDFARNCWNAFEFGLLFPIGCFALFLPMWLFGVSGWLVFWGLVMGYLAPSIMSGKHHNARAITVLNILLGWTVIGWIAALVWALTKPPESARSRPEG